MSKGLNRGMGTIAGGGLGCLAALSAREIGHVTRAIALSMSVFVVGNYTPLYSKTFSTNMGSHIPLRHSC